MEQAEPDRPPLIEVRQLVKVYKTPAGELAVIKRLDVEVLPGEFVAVIGKSTFINLLTSIDRPTSGEIVVAGARLHTFSEGQLAAWRGRQLAIVFQFFQLIPTLTVLENVILPRRRAFQYPPSDRLPFNFGGALGGDFGFGLSVSAIGSSALQQGKSQTTAAAYASFSIRHRIVCPSTASDRRITAWLDGLSVSAIGSSALQRVHHPGLPRNAPLSVSAIGSSALQHEGDTYPCDICDLSVSAIGSSALQRGIHPGRDLGLDFQYPPSDRLPFNVVVVIHLAARIGLSVSAIGSSALQQSWPPG